MRSDEARKIIRALMDAAHDCAIVPFYAEGLRVESINRPGRPMLLKEAEERQDQAIQAAWWFMVQEPLQVEDPVSFIMEVED